MKSSIPASISTAQSAQCSGRIQLLPPKFTLTELQQLYEAILATKLDKRDFRKKILSMGLLLDLNQVQENVAHRPAKLYQFDRENYEQFVSEGFSFGV